MSNLTKRAWDRRILHVDLSPVLRSGDTPSRIVSVEATPLSGEAMLSITDISLAGKSVSFLVSGGTADQFHRLIIRFEVDTMPGQMIEGVTGIRIE